MAQPGAGMNWGQPMPQQQQQQQPKSSSSIQHPSQLHRSSHHDPYHGHHGDKNRSRHPPQGGMDPSRQSGSHPHAQQQQQGVPSAAVPMKKKSIFDIESPPPVSNTVGKPEFPPAYDHQKGRQAA